jgi:glutamate-ammonia-ligase adenylyltransferase
MSAIQEILAPAGDAALRRLLERAEPATAAALEALFAAAPWCEQVPRMLSCSPFVAETAARDPDGLLELMQSGDIQRSLRNGELQTSLAQLLQAGDADLKTVLRRFRRRHMLRIVWRDFCRLADTAETVGDTSALAEASIAEAQRVLTTELEQRFGVPRGRHSGERQSLIVIGMGKLGARELNISSDIDLIFTFPESGQTDSQERPLGNEQFFIKLGQALIASLDQVTAEGFVFRVDMRLRPYGESGALVHNFTALEEYYQDQGRDWERYALIKARPLTGDPERAAELAAMLRPFVYRRYIDFGAIESLRSMKQLITAEVRRRGLHNNVKLGRGGIREVEFIAQCFQLIRGGRDLGLQQRQLLPVLEECVSLGCLPQQAVTELQQAYCFLRDSEHAIQGYQDRQSQTLPGEALAQAAMARVMGFASWEDYLATLQAHRTRVEGYFDGLIAAPEEATGPATDGLLLWGEDLGADALHTLGFTAPAEAVELLRGLHQNPRVMTLQVQGRERLDEFMPLLVRACAEDSDPNLALQRVLPLVQSVLRRSAYLALLIENPPALAELVTLCGASPWIAEQMARHPVLLDELLDRASLYTAPDRAQLQDELRQQVMRLAESDLEAQMETLRYFKASQVLRVAASELAGRLPLKQVSDKLTWIAEVILEHVQAVAWADLVARFGEPARAGEGTGFAVLGYGKLGGIELGYGSDLDLVFIYDAAGQGVTNGKRVIDNTVFYTRLGQRIIHILDARMPLGQLYEVDMRLRPSGESGMLATSLQAFSNYQRESAWTWEHQALVRARFVAGDEAVAAQVEAIRREILCRPRQEAALASEVTGMRQKMRDNLLPGGAAAEGLFYLKQGVGGIVDIEFMVQYAVLAWSHRVAELARWSDNVRILETLAAEGLFQQSECDILTEAYLAYRSAAHQLALQQETAAVPADQFLEFRAAVEDKWQQLFTGR